MDVLPCGLSASSGDETCLGALPDQAALEFRQSAKHLKNQPPKRRWGRHGEKPPGDSDGFLAYAQRLRTPTIYDAINKAEQLGEIVRFGFPASFRRHFDRLAEFPRGLLPFGDSICRFNPVYGQGMSVAAQEARLLHELLASHGAEPDPLAGLAPAFFAEPTSLIETPWAMAATPDFGAPQDGGPAARESTAKSRSHGGVVPPRRRRWRRTQTDIRGIAPAQTAKRAPPPRPR